MQSKTLTIMFVDVQGYASLTAQKKRDEQILFVNEIKAFVEKHVLAKSGRLIKTMGDGFLITFDSPTDAISCGNELQKEISRRNSNILNTENFILFRIGISTGEANIDDSGDVFGDVVNIAARIQKFAEPNEVFISESTYLAMNTAEIKAQDLGPQKFKNVLREVRVFKVLKDGDAPAAPKVQKPKTEKQLTNTLLVVVIILLSLGIVAILLNLKSSRGGQAADLIDQNQQIKRQELFKPNEFSGFTTRIQQQELKMQEKPPLVQQPVQTMPPQGQIQQPVTLNSNIQMQPQPQMQTGTMQQGVMQPQTNSGYDAWQPRPNTMHTNVLDSQNSRQFNRQRRHPCGDGVCDQFEQANSNLCPQDCQDK